MTESKQEETGERRPSAAKRMGLVGLFVGVAVADFWTGYELWFSIFYLGFIGWSAWHLGPVQGVLVAAASVVCSLTGDLASGVKYTSSFVPWWNVLISLCFYLAVVWILLRLKASQQSLETLVDERTAALRQEMAERERLERALLEVSEREQRRIGHELHDSLCQHLTGTAMAAQVLGLQLSAAGHKEAAAADQVVTMVEEGIDLSRSLARGLAPLELDAEGLVEAVRELAVTTSARGLIHCRVEVKGALKVGRSDAATQLFRIAQEAVHNAVKHAKAKHIGIVLAQDPSGVCLQVNDDGVGLSDSWAEQGGMGLHIMRYRAAMVGAIFEIHTLPVGTSVSVRWPSDEPSSVE